MPQDLSIFITVRMNPQDVNYLDAIATKQRKHRTEVLRDLVRNARDYSVT